MYRWVKQSTATMLEQQYALCPRESFQFLEVPNAYHAQVSRRLLMSTTNAWKGFCKAKRVHLTQKSIFILLAQSFNGH